MCQEAWKLIREAQAGVRYTGPEPRPGPEQEEQLVYESRAAFMARCSATNSRTDCARAWARNRRTSSSA